MLTDSQVKSAKCSGDSRAILTDGNGLSLYVYPSGKKKWKLRLYHEGKENLISIGDYPKVSLADARNIAQDKRQDPLSAVQGISLSVRTFGAVAEEWLIKRKIPTCKDTHISDIKQRLKNHIYPYIEKVAVKDVSPQIILGIARRIEATGHIETCYRVIDIISQVLRYGVATEEVERDYTQDIRGAVQSRSEVEHYAMLADEGDIGSMLRAVKNLDSVITRNAITFISYTAVRTIELRHAEWTEFDLKNSLWTIPGEKMKGKRLQLRPDHIVPLSRQALKVLEDMKAVNGGRQYVFPQLRKRDKAMSEATILVGIKKALKSIYLPEDSHCGHGFRAMASTILNRCGWKEAAVDFQLAHKPKDKISAAYNRNTYLEIRIPMMQWYADYLDALRDGTTKPDESLIIR